MKKSIMVALLVAVAGCSQTGDGGEGSAAVQPSEVTPEQLRAAVDDPRLVRFYEARAWAPAWDKETARMLTEALGQAAVHGLDPKVFLAPVEEKTAPAEREAALSLAAIEYADALANGRVDPGEMFRPFELDVAKADVAAGLNKALGEGDVPAWLASLAPQDDEYRLLSRAYAEAVRRAEAKARTIPEGDDIRPGRSDQRIPLIVAGLRADGYLAAPPAPAEGQKAQAPSNVYGEETVAAVRRLQAEYGLEADGVIDERTLAAINEGAYGRARRLAIALERRRWMPRQAAATRIDVNIPAAELVFWRDGRLADRRPVVVGQPGNETPQLASPMFRLVANPTWTVPKSIAEEEILPKGAGYMSRNNMSMKDGMVVQASGPKNALGEVKFDMKNDHAIYLHDTPAKALFERDARYFSHGCVRVSDALGFAQMIAQQEGVLDRFRKALASGEETFVQLPREIPVRLLYTTVAVDNGQLRFLPDPYGWDGQVAEGLGLAPAPPLAKAVHVSDIGP